MRNLSKLFLPFITLFVMNASVFAGEAIIFDNPSLVAYREGGRIFGFYDAENDRFSCSFMFVQDAAEKHVPKDGDYSSTNLLTFASSDRSFLFADRDKVFDIEGSLYRNDDKWVIYTSTGQAGCENSAGGFTFDLGSMQAVIYYVEKTIPAVGIRLVKTKSNFYDYRSGKFASRKGYLTKWNPVIVLEKRDQFSFVRFSDPRLNVKSYGHVTTGWVHSADLADPFPPVSRERKQ